MKYFIAILFCFLSTLAFSQGAGIRYMDTIPTHTPNPALRHSVVVYNTTNDTYYHHQDGKWKDLGILRVVDSTLQILNEQYSLGDRILVKSTGEQFLVQTDSFFLVDSIYAIPVGSNYAVWQPGFNHQGEFILDTLDNGSYKLQVTGSSYFRSDGYASMYLDGAVGAGLALFGNSYDASLTLSTNGGQWILNNNDEDGNLRLGGSSGRFFDIWGKSGYSPSSTTNITAAGGITVTFGIMRVQGSGGAVDITADPQIADGNDGEIVILEGMSDTNTLTLDDGTGLQLAGGASFVMGLGDVIQLMYNANRDIWIELTRSDN